jgi:hypothetical protein
MYFACKGFRGIPGWNQQKKNASTKSKPEEPSGSSVQLFEGLFAQIE